MSIAPSPEEIEFERQKAEDISFYVKQAKRGVLREALQVIADLPAPENPLIIDGHEDAYRAVMKLMNEQEN